MPAQEAPAPSFDEIYRSGAPPWDIGRPQADVAALVREGFFRSPVLDAGCGTGENAMYLAGQGLRVLGVDSAPRALASARAKAQARGVEGVEFREQDALDLAALGRTFASVLDCGLFHVYDDEGRGRYVRSLASVVDPGGAVGLLCFSEDEPPGWGPRRVTQAELRDAFRSGWSVDSIRPARFETREGHDARAWLARIRRSG
jgi:SAM-dependent methyltransferase